MSIFSKEKSFTVETVDGGWILDWRDETRAKDRSEFTQWPIPVQPKTSGREIFTNKKALQKRINALI